jgi:hypothetical protein
MTIVGPLTQIVGGEHLYLLTVDNEYLVSLTVFYRPSVKYLSAKGELKNLV